MKNVPKRKILFMQCFPLWGCGSGTYTRDLATELTEQKNIDTAILCPDKRKVNGVKIYPLEMPFPVAFTGHPEWPICRLYKDLSPQEIVTVCEFFLKSAIRAVEDFKPNIIHVQHVSILLWVANIIKSLYGINFIATAHGTCVDTASVNKKYIPLCIDGLRGAKRIVAVSNDTKDWLLRVFGNEFRHKTKIIPGGIHFNQYPEKIKFKMLNKKYNLKNKKIVFFSGKLTPRKGVWYLVKAAKKIKGHIYIAGDGPEMESLQNLKRRLKLKNVHFLGYMGDERKEEFKEWYYKSDVFVAPSVWDEPLGLVLLEAMVAKTPVVVTRKGGIPLAVKEGLNGLFVRPRNSSDLAEKINNILQNTKLRKKMSENARKVVQKKFNWKTIAQKYQRIYKNFYSNTNGK